MRRAESPRGCGICGTRVSGCSITKPVYGFCEGTYQSVALHLSTSMGLFSVDGIDRSVSVTIGVYLPGIDQGIDF